MKNLLDTATEIINTKRQWYVGEVVTLWNKGNIHVYLINEDEQIRMYLFKNNDSLTKRIYSKPFLVGQLIPLLGWMADINNLNETQYQKWVKDTKRKLQPLVNTLVNTSVNKKVRISPNYYG